TFGEESAAIRHLYRHLIASGRGFSGAMSGMTASPGERPGVAPQTTLQAGRRLGRVMTTTPAPRSMIPRPKRPCLVLEAPVRASPEGGVVAPGAGAAAPVPAGDDGVEAPGAAGVEPPAEAAVRGVAGGRGTAVPGRAADGAARGLGAPGETAPGVSAAAVGAPAGGAGGGGRGWPGAATGMKPWSGTRSVA